MNDGNGEQLPKIIRHQQRHQQKSHACIHACCSAYGSDVKCITLPSGPKCDKLVLRKLLVYLGRERTYIDMAISNITEKKKICYYACLTHFQKVEQRYGQAPIITMFDSDKVTELDPLYTQRLNLREDNATEIIKKIEASRTPKKIENGLRLTDRQEIIAVQRFEQFANPSSVSKLEAENVELKQQMRLLQAALKKSSNKCAQHVLIVKQLREDLTNSVVPPIYSFEQLCTKSDDFIYKMTGFKTVQLFKDIVQMHLDRVTKIGLEQFKGDLKFEDYLCMMWIKYEVGISAQFIADLFGATYNSTFTEKLRLVLVMSNWVYTDTFRTHQNLEDINDERDPYYEVEPWTKVREVWDGYCFHRVFVHGSRVLL